MLHLTTTTIATIIITTTTVIIIIITITTTTTTIIIIIIMKGKNILFNDTLNTFYLRLHGVRNMVKDHSDSTRRNPLLFPIISNVLLYTPSHRQDSTYHGLCYQLWTLAGIRNSLMGPPWRIYPMTHCTMR